MAHAVVLGGGFGGLAAAHELRRLLPADDEVTLIAARDHFFVGFAKLWDLVGSRPLADGSAALSALEGHGIRYLQAEVTGLDAAAHTVATSAGDLQADGLVVALGAGYLPAHLDLLGDVGHNLYDATALPAMRRALEGLTAGRLVVSILGGPYQCPPAPYEAALLILERLEREGRRPDVEVLVSTPQPITLPVAGPDASRFLAERLTERGAVLRTGQAVEAIDSERRSVRLGGEDLPFDVLFGVPASSPLRVLADNALAGASGWIEPDPLTFATTFERVYAVGDCTQVPTATAQLPKAGIFAERGGRVAAANLAADLHGGDRTHFDGQGHCYLELPGEQVATVSGNFYAQPAPDVTLSEATHDAYLAKQRWEQDRLTSWLS